MMRDTKATGSKLQEGRMDNFNLKMSPGRGMDE